LVVTERLHQPAPTEETFYEVQVGAFEERDEAHKVLETVRECFPEAYIAPCHAPTGKYYQVRVGPFAAEEEAKQVAKVLKHQGSTFSSMRSPRMLSHHRPLIPSQSRTTQQSNK
jgi:cell division septation protein DedD